MPEQSLNDTIEAEVGMTVFFYPYADRNREPFSAQITQVNPMTVNLMVFSAGGSFFPRTGVYNVNDPRSQNENTRADCGAWDFTNHTKTLLKLKADLESLLSTRPTKKKET